MKTNVRHYVSNAELKRMKAREHNRAYLAGELDKKNDVADFVRHVAEGFQAVVKPPKE